VRDGGLRGRPRAQRGGGRLGEEVGPVEGARPGQGRERLRHAHDPILADARAGPEEPVPKSRSRRAGPEEPARASCHRAPEGSPEGARRQCWNVGAMTARAIVWNSAWNATAVGGVSGPT